MGIVVAILVVVLVIALFALYLDRDHVVGAIEASEIKVATYAHQYVANREAALKRLIAELEQRIIDLEKKYTPSH